MRRPVAPTPPPSQAPTILLFPKIGMPTLKGTIHPRARLRTRAQGASKSRSSPSIMSNFRNCRMGSRGSFPLTWSCPLFNLDFLLGYRVLVIASHLLIRLPVLFPSNCQPVYGGGLHPFFFVFASKIKGLSSNRDCSPRCSQQIFTNSRFRVHTRFRTSLLGS